MVHVRVKVHKVVTTDVCEISTCPCHLVSDPTRKEKKVEFIKREGVKVL